MFAAIGHALMMSIRDDWEILWALILGSGLSAIIQAVVSKEEMSRLLLDDSACTVALQPRAASNSDPQKGTAARLNVVLPPREGQPLPAIAARVVGTHPS
jgi:hypothetical protein